MPSGSICVVTNDKIPFYFMAEYYCTVYVPHFLHYCSNAAVNMGHIYLTELVFLFSSDKFRVLSEHPTLLAQF